MRFSVSPIQCLLASMEGLAVSDLRLVGEGIEVGLVLGQRIGHDDGREADPELEHGRRHALADQPVQPHEVGNLRCERNRRLAGRGVIRVVLSSLPGSS
jgi:hypothetical protein